MKYHNVFYVKNISATFAVIAIFIMKKKKEEDVIHFQTLCEHMFVYLSFYVISIYIHEANGTNVNILSTSTKMVSSKLVSCLKVYVENTVQ